MGREVERNWSMETHDGVSMMKQNERRKNDGTLETWRLDRRKPLTEELMRSVGMHEIDRQRFIADLSTKLEGAEYLNHLRLSAKRKEWGQKDMGAYL